MSEQEINGAGDETEVSCLQCGADIPPGTPRHTTEDGAVCAACLEAIKSQVQATIGEQGRDINWVNALLGGLLGGSLGVLIWWGLTVLTSRSFGLVAIVIGFLVGKGVVMLTGGKRARGLQILSVLIATVAYGYASYLVMRTFLLRLAADDPDLSLMIGLPLLPDPGRLVDVVRLDFGIMDMVFLAIVIWQAWRMPAPIRLED
ncbi:hypothetical protein H8E07_07230 [bacterium]|nr:hypothetical protein [bacterium]